LIVLTAPFGITNDVGYDSPIDNNKGVKWVNLAE